MPLQNRVLPNGEIVAGSWRGSVMGNRGGRIHDPVSRELTKRRWTSKRWIICRTKFKNRKRLVMGNSYTELFFLDEVSALAAGHRPCFECQRERAKKFAETWERCFGSITGSKADHIDTVLHAERTKMPDSLTATDIGELPDGAFFGSADRFFTIRQGRVLEWSGNGYSRSLASRQDSMLLTPPSIVAVLGMGYEPMWHEPPSRNFGD